MTKEELFEKAAALVRDPELGTILYEYTFQYLEKNDEIALIDSAEQLTHGILKHPVVNPTIPVGCFYMIIKSHGYVANDAVTFNAGTIIERKMEAFAAFLAMLEDVKCQCETSSSSDEDSDSDDDSDDDLRLNFRGFYAIDTANDANERASVIKIKFERFSKYSVALHDSSMKNRRLKNLMWSLFWYFQENKDSNAILRGMEDSFTSIYTYEVARAVFNEYCYLEGFVRPAAHNAKAFVIADHNGLETFLDALSLHDENIIQEEKKDMSYSGDTFLERAYLAEELDGAQDKRIDSLKRIMKQEDDRPGTNKKLKLNGEQVMAPPATKKTVRFSGHDQVKLFSRQAEEYGNDYEQQDQPHP